MCESPQFEGTKLRARPAQCANHRSLRGTKLRGRPTQCANHRSLRGQCCVDAQLSVRNAAVSVLETARVSRKTNGRKHLQFQLGHRSRCTTTHLQSCQPRGVRWSLSCTRGIWKTERAGPDYDPRMFLGELGAVAVERVGVASRSRIAFPLAAVPFKLEAALPVSSQSAQPSARVLSVLVVFRGSLSSFVVTCMGGKLLSQKMMSSCGT